jgi:hypothetical protein
MSLLPTSYKIVSNISLLRLSPYVLEIIGDHWCRFRCNRSAADQIVCIRQILEKKWGKMRIHCLFVDLKKEYDSVRREVLYSIVTEFGVPMKLDRVLKMCVMKPVVKPL